MMLATFAQRIDSVPLDAVILSRAPWFKTGHGQKGEGVLSL
jgi:hypothetical protein